MAKGKNELIVLGNIQPANNDKIHQRNWVVSQDGIVGTLTATMFKDPPRVMVWKRKG